MSKIVTAKDACEIGKKYAESFIEEKFIDIMDKIASSSRRHNLLVISDHLHMTSVGDNEYATFLQDHPEQVQRLINMGYEVEQAIIEYPISYNSEELVTVPFLYFWTKDVYKTTIKETTLSAAALLSLGNVRIVMVNETRQLFKITQACLENIALAINERLNNAANPLELEQLNKLKVDIKKSKSTVDELLKGG